MQYEFKNDCWKKTDITIYADKRKRGELLAPPLDGFGYRE